MNWTYYAMSIIISIVTCLLCILLMQFLQVKAQNKVFGESVSAIVVGKKVRTLGGIHGLVKEVDGFNAKVEIAKGVIVEIDKLSLVVIE